MRKVYVKNYRGYMFFDLDLDYKNLYHKELLALIIEIRKKNTELVNKYLNDSLRSIVISKSEFSRKIKRQNICTEIFYSELFECYFIGAFSNRVLRYITLTENVLDIDNVYFDSFYVFADNPSEFLQEGYPIIATTKFSECKYFIKNKSIETFYINLERKLEFLQEKIETWLQ